MRGDGRERGGPAILGPRVADQLIHPMKEWKNLDRRVVDEVNPLGSGAGTVHDVVGPARVEPGRRPVRRGVARAGRGGQRPRRQQLRVSVPSREEQPGDGGERRWAGRQRAGFLR